MLDMSREQVHDTVVWHCYEIPPFWWISDVGTNRTLCLYLLNA